MQPASLGFHRLQKAVPSGSGYQTGHSCLRDQIIGLTSGDAATPREVTCVTVVRNPHGVAELLAAEDQGASLRLAEMLGRPGRRPAEHCASNSLNLVLLDGVVDVDRSPSHAASVSARSGGKKRADCSAS